MQVSQVSVQSLLGFRFRFAIFGNALALVHRTSSCPAILAHVNGALALCSSSHSNTSLAFRLGKQAIESPLVAYRLRKSVVETSRSSSERYSFAFFCTSFEKSISLFFRYFPPAPYSQCSTSEISTSSAARSPPTQAERVER